MRIYIRGIAKALTGLLLFAMLFALYALAEGDTVELSVRITAEGALPKTEETYAVRMTANGEDMPMPDNQTGGSCDLHINGINESAFPIIKYDAVGVYTYTIRELAGANSDCTYDNRVYTMNVLVTNAENGKFDINVALREEGKDEKPDAVIFHNKYKTAPSHTTPPGSITSTGVDDYWIFYLIGSVLLLCLAGFIVSMLVRREDD